MDRTILRIFTVALAAILLAGCSSYSKLMKSGDHEKMYEKGLEYYKARKYQRTLQLFEEIDPYYAGTSREDTIKFHMAAACYNQGDFETSGMLFDQFRRSHRGSPYLEQAEFMYAMGFYYSSPNPERDQTNSIKAIMAITEYMDRYPNTIKKDDLNERIAELQRKLYDKEYLNAKTYYTIGKYKAATIALKNALDASPDNPHREEMMYLVTKSGYLLAFHSIPSMQMDRYLKMMDYYLNFASEFPDSKYSNELAKMMDHAKEYVAQNSTDTEKHNKATEDGTQKE